MSLFLLIVPVLPSDGSWGGGGRVRDAGPLLGQNFFIFMQFSGKIGRNSMLATPLMGWRSSLWEILDPPLLPANLSN